MIRGLPRQRIDPRFRAAQAASQAGRHDEAEALFAAVAAADPGHPHLALQRALAAARAGRAPAAELLDLPDDGPLATFVRLRAAPLETVEALLASLPAEPENRVTATVRAYGLARLGRLGEALEALEPYPGDNFEVLAWAWAELERALALRDVWPEPDLPILPQVRGSQRAARRWFRAGIAAAYRHENVLVRRWLLARGRAGGPLRWLRGTLEELDRWWPCDALQAFRQAKAAGLSRPLLDEMLGAELLAAGYPAAALAPLTAAAEAIKLEPDGTLSEEAGRPVLLRAAALLELHRWSEADAVLTQLAGGDDDERSRAHDFGEPIWQALRGRLAAARGDLAGAAAAFLRALDGEPLVADDRLAQMRERLTRSRPG